MVIKFLSLMLSRLCKEVNSVGCYMCGQISLFCTVIIVLYLFNVQKQNTSKIDHLYCIEDIENELVVTASKGSGGSQLCSSDKMFQQYWYKKFPDNTSDKYFLIVALTDGKLCAISCTTEGESRDRSDYLWKEKDEHIVSVRYGLVIGVHESETEASLILCEREESKYKLKL